MDDIIFYQIILWFHFVPLSESNNIYKYAHVFVIQNGTDENPRKLLVVAIVVTDLPICVILIDTVERSMSWPQS